MQATEPLSHHILPNTIGLALCGGASSRMGTDKSMLQYYNKPQRYYLYDLLSSLCDKVFISINEQQLGTKESGYNYIQDNISFGKIGPMVALLTAFTKFPETNVLLIGCDYPFLTTRELQRFSTFCKEDAIAFYNVENEIYEPILAWYPFKCFQKLQEMFLAKEYSLQHFLTQCGAAKYLPEDENSIKSIDTIEAYTETLKLINAI